MHSDRGAPSPDGGGDSDDDTPSSHRDDDRAVNPQQSTLVRDALTVRGTAPANHHRRASSANRMLSRSESDHQADGAPSLAGPLSSSDAISANFAATQHRVSMFHPGTIANRDNGSTPTPSSGSGGGGGGGGGVEHSACRARNQQVLEQLRLAEEQRREVGDSTHHSGPAAGGAAGADGDGEDAVSVATEDEEGVLWGEYHTYNLRDSAFGCISPGSQFRRRLFFVIDHPWFESLILVLITLNIIAMILDTPGIREQPGIAGIVLVSDIVFQTLFTLEMIVKMLALGVVFHKHSYLRSPWNAIDACIVIFGFVAYFLDAQWRTLRIVRVFRLLKALGRVKQLHSISVALSNSGGRMGDVTLLMLFVTCTMAVLGLQLFVGSFQRRCYFYLPQPVYDPFVAFPNGTIDLSLSFLTNRTTLQPVLDPLDSSLCGNSDGGHTCTPGAVCATHLDVYHQEYLNFDHFGYAIFYVLKLITMDNWPADNVYMQQAEGFFYFIYTFAVVIFGSFFCLNLILAILSGEYEAVVKEQAEGAADGADPAAAGGANASDAALLLGSGGGGGGGEDDDDELRDLDSDDGDASVRGVGGGDLAASPDYGAPGEGGERSGAEKEEQSILQMLRGLAKRFIHNPWFSRTILLVTTINVIALGCDHHPIDPTFDMVLDNINFTCSIIFIVEAVIKIFALLAKYFYDGFNVFDFLLCIVSIPEMILSSGGSTFSALRAFRLARVVRVLNNSKTMRQLLITVVDAARGSSFLFLFLGLYILTASIFAVNFMEGSVPASVRPNFTTLGDSVLALFIVVTGENWVEIAVTSIAGSSWATAVFFYGYYAIGNFVLLNFVVVILITSFNQAAERLRSEEQAELERLRAIEAREQRLLLAQKEFLEEAGTFEGEASGQQGPEELKFVDLSSDGPKDGAKTSSRSHTADEKVLCTTSESDGSALSPGISGQYSDGGEVAVKATSTSFRRAQQHGTVTTARADGAGNARSPPDTAGAVKRSQSKTDVNSPTSGGASSGGKTVSPGAAKLSPRQKSEPPERPPEVSVMDLRHREMPLQSIFTMMQEAVGEPLTDDEIREKMVGKSFKIWGADSGFRFAVAKIVSHPAFEAVVTLIIMESCIALGFENPDSKTNPDVDAFLTINSFVLVALFAVEALLRCIAWGAFWGDGTYLSDNWNRIDFFVLIVSVVSIFISESASLRSLRIFRLAAKVSALRTVIAAVVFAVPGIANVALLILFSFIVFGILGVQLFKGKFVSCTDPSIVVRTECFGYFNVSTDFYEVVNGTTVLSTLVESQARRWTYDYFNFNHLGIAVLTLIQQMYSDGWSVVLYSAMDSRSYDQAKEQDASPENAIFFVIFIIVGNFFLINLFVGSLIDSFSHERNVSDGKIDEDGNPLLTEEQDRWIRTFRVMDATALLPYISKAGNPFRGLCQYIYFADDDRLSPSLKFEWFITSAIILNALLMCTTHSDQPDWWTAVIWWSNLSFACLFALEAIIKMSALLPAAYFADSWNRFDFLMVPTAFISLFLGGPGTNAIRVLRVARVLRLVKRAKGLKRLFDSLLYALPQLANISMLLMLTLFVFGVVGTAFFANVLIDPQSDFPLSDDFNFKNALNSMVLLFQISTTESWPDVMRACMMNEENSRCTAAAGNCGTWVSIPYFLLFMMVANSVALNLFIFVIVDNYMEVNSMNNEEDQRLFYRLSLFRTSWSLVDRDGDQRLKWDTFVLILRRIMRENASLAGPDGEAADGTVNLTKEEMEQMKMDIAEEAKDEEKLDNGDRVVVPLNRSNANPSSSMLRNQSAKEIDIQRSIVQFLMSNREATFMRMLRRMDIPLDRDGNVRYGDCVYAITKEHHGLDSNAERQAARFLGLTRDRDPSCFYDAFKVHHALAVRKIMRLLKMRHKEAQLQRRVKAIFNPPGSLADGIESGTADDDDDDDGIPDDSGATSFAKSDPGNEPSRPHSVMLQALNNESSSRNNVAAADGDDEQRLPGAVPTAGPSQPASPMRRQASSEASRSSSRQSQPMSPSAKE